MDLNEIEQEGMDWIHPA